jgi:phosphatidate cytidylyltransferase
MKQRLLSAAVGIPLAVVVVFFYNNILLNIAIAAVTLIAVYEIFVATKYLRNRGLVVICFIFAAFVPFFHIAHFHIVSEAFCFIFILVLFIFLLFNHRTMKFEQIGTVFMLTLLLSFSFSCIVFTRDIYAHRHITDNIAMFYISLVFLGAWVTDAGAYFIGRFFGKTKLAPIISPKKTVEGAVGGLVCTVVCFFIVALIYRAYVLSIGQTITVHYMLLGIAALLSAIVAILGDLSASLIKRECNIKDFGNILPGHGGIMDRFDSVMFVAPLLFIFQQIFPIISK